MSDEKPLHVRVAEALGWSMCEFKPPKNLMDMGDKGRWVGYPGPHHSGLPIVGKKEPVPLHDTDWSATGPQLERVLASFGDVDFTYHAEQVPAMRWRVGLYIGNDRYVGHGAGLPAATCELLLVLHAAGKLAR